MKKIYSKSINTVNVITYHDGCVQSITSYKDSPSGNKSAEKLFTTLIKENCPDTTKEDIEASLDNGYFEQENFWQAFIVHST